MPPVKETVTGGFGKVLRKDVRDAGKVCNCACNLDDTGVSALTILVLCTILIKKLRAKIYLLVLTSLFTLLGDRIENLQHLTSGMKS